MTTIAYILKMYPRFSETFIVNEILELERQGVDVRVYSLRKPDDGRFHARLAKVKANVIYVPQYPEMEPERVRPAHEFLLALDPERYVALRDHALSLPQPYGLKRFLQAGVVAAHLLRQPVDAMHAHFASSGTRVAEIVNRITGIPYSFTAHAKDIYHQEVNPESLRRKMENARFVVTVSHFNRDYLHGLLTGRPADLRCLYNGIDLKLFKPGRPDQRQANLILSVGRLVDKKGFDHLIRACAILAERGLDFRCEIVGKGEREESLRQLIAGLGLEGRVRLLGPKPQEQVLRAYRRAAVFALPCVISDDGNRDGLPTVLLEAMATQTPAVSTNLAGIPEIIEHERDGLLVDAGDTANLPLALADALERLLGDAELRGRLGQAARQKVERQFNVRHNVATLRRWLAAGAASGLPAADQGPETVADPRFAQAVGRRPTAGDREASASDQSPATNSQASVFILPPVPRLEEVLVSP